MDQQPATPASAAESWYDPKRAWKIAALLALASIFSQFDRNVISLAVGPVKAAFQLDDTHFAMLQGLAFGLCYAICTVPIGRLSDRYERRVVLGCSLALFSLSSISSGFSRSFAQLFATRVGVGVGEAAVTPGGLSLLSDLFPAKRLGRATSLFFLTAPLGVGLSMIAGGKLLEWLTARSNAGALPFELQPWQAAFLLIGIPGLLLSPIFLMMREPARRGAGSESPLSVAQVLDVIRSRREALLLIVAGFSLQTLVMFAYNIWTPALFARTYGWSPAEVGLGFGLVVLIFGTGGAWFAGWLSDRMSARNQLDAHLRIAALASLGCGVCGAAAPLMPSAWGALALIGPAIFLVTMPVPCAGIALQLILPNRARAQVTGIFYMVTGLVGLGIGPLLIGLMNDHVFRGPGDIRYSLAVVVGIASPLMFLLLRAAAAPYRAIREITERERRNQETGR